MEDIAIIFKGEIDLTLQGEIIGGSHNERNRSIRFRLYSNRDDNDIKIPSSSQELNNTTMTIRTNEESSPTFWRIFVINKENNEYEIKIYPNSSDLILNR